MTSWTSPSSSRTSTPSSEKSSRSVPRAPIELRDDRRLRQALRISEAAAGKGVLALLRRELGVLTTARVLRRIVFEQARGEPFRALGPPASRREELTRRQLGPAALLLGALRRHVSVGEAERLTRAAVEMGGMVFLGSLLGDLDPATVGDIAIEVRERLGRFFNAEGEVAIGEDEASYTVHRCLFVELAPRIGAASLLPAFCAVDRTFFDSGLTPLKLSRTETLAGGDERCDFHFRWAER